MLNQCAFIGNLGRDPEIKTFNDGGRIANMSIAVSEKWKDKTSGEAKERTEWVNISVKSDGLVGICERYLKKGSKIYVQGKMQTRKYEKDGSDRYVTEIVLQGFDAKIEMLDGKPDGARDTGGWGDDQRDARSAQQSHGDVRMAGGGGGGFAGGADLDDDVPFATCDPAAEERRHVA